MFKKSLIAVFAPRRLLAALSACPSTARYEGMPPPCQEPPGSRSPSTRTSSTRPRRDRRRRRHTRPRTGADRPGRARRRRGAALVGAAVAAAVAPGLARRHDRQGHERGRGGRAALPAGGRHRACRARPRARPRPGPGSALRAHPTGGGLAPVRARMSPRCVSTGRPRWKGGRMQTTHYGHSCVLLDTGSARLLFDPGTFSEGFESAGGLDAVLITHQHVDHLDTDRLRPLLEANPDARLIVDSGT